MLVAKETLIFYGNSLKNTGETTSTYGSKSVASNQGKQQNSL
jgi:hypothetical protein